MTRIVLAISGASGVPIAVRTATALAEQVDLVTVVTDGAKRVMAHETDDREETMAHLRELSTAVYDDDAMGAPVASGSYDVDGVAVVPASMNTVSKIATGQSDNLVVRAADVALKERRPLVVVPRESPLSELHLRNLQTLAGMGVDVVPPVLGFYYDPQTLGDAIDHTVGKILERFDLEHDCYDTWGE